MKILLFFLLETPDQDVHRNRCCEGINEQACCRMSSGLERLFLENQSVGGKPGAEVAVEANMHLGTQALKFHVCHENRRRLL